MGTRPKFFGYISVRAIPQTNRRGKGRLPEVTRFSNQFGIAKRNWWQFLMVTTTTVPPPMDAWNRSSIWSGICTRGPGLSPNNPHDGNSRERPLHHPRA
jgi:hypothetical protein